MKSDYNDGDKQEDEKQNITPGNLDNKEHNMDENNSMIAESNLIFSKILVGGD